QNPGNRRIVFDLGRANNRVEARVLMKISDTELQGFQKVGNRETIDFYAVLSDSILGVENDNEGSHNGHAPIDVRPGDQKVTLKVGLSYVSASNAKQNLEAEIGNKGFGDIHDEGRQAWKGLLDKIQIAGGSEGQQEMFYSSLY